jgi:putative transcriptional regulator
MHLSYLLFMACLCLLPEPGAAASLHTALTPAISSPAPPGGLERQPAAGMFLVAKRDLRDPHFNRSVIYLLEHGPEGSVGLIVNRPSGVKLSEVITGIREQVAARHSLYFGGPVQHRQVIMLMRNAGQTRQIRRVVGDIYFSADRNVMNRLLAENKPQDELHFYAGHASWSAGQLARELQGDSWHLIEGDPQDIFSTNPGSLWERLIEQLEPHGLYVKTGLINRS